MDECNGIKKALVEYGFGTKMNAKTKILWAKVYRRLLRRCSFLRVQQAWDKGGLLDLAGSLRSEGPPFEIDDEVRLVLQRLRRRE